MDRLSALFSRFTPTARVFHSGQLCQTVNFYPEGDVGYLHLLRAGPLTVVAGDDSVLELSEPSALFYPRPCGHQLRTHDNGAELLCATVELGSGAQNPLTHALPAMVSLPLSELPTLGPALELLFAEGLTPRCGRQAALDRLMEYVLIQLLRHLLDSSAQTNGLLAALADPKLARAVTAMHERPADGWTLEALALEAGMSRARFALHFRQTVGMTPLDYLTGWRIGVAQTQLLRGKSIKAVARDVGYQSQATLSRVFSQRCGVSPSQWLDAQRRLPDATSARCS